MEDLLLSVNGKEFKAEFSDSDSSEIKINDKVYNVEMLKEYNNNIYSFLANNKLSQVEMELDEQKNLSILYDGLSYDVSVTNETKKMLQQFIKNSGTGSNANPGLMKAPMPGMVVKIMVNVGMAVNEGDTVIIIEAMKMENSLKSPVTGTVKTIKAVEGKAVEKNAVLIEIQPGVE